MYKIASHDGTRRKITNNAGYLKIIKIVDNYHMCFWMYSDIYDFVGTQKLFLKLECLKKLHE